MSSLAGFTPTPRLKRALKAGLVGVAAIGVLIVGPALGTPIGGGSGAPLPSPGSGAGTVVTTRPGHGAIAVSWQPPSVVPPPTGYLVRVYDRLTGYVGQAQCAASCTSLVVGPVAAGRTYTVSVSPTGAGWYPVATSTVTLPSGCASAAVCVGVDAARTTGPARRRAQGFLHAVAGGPLPANVAALRPTSWRVGGAAGPSVPSLNAAGAATTYVLSDDWYNATDTSQQGGARPPWNDWSGYAAFVRTTVHNLVVGGQAPTYWEVQNEPDSKGYFGPMTFPTVAQTLQQWDVAVAAIRSVLPSARIVGPALSAFSLRPGATGPGLDLATFLDHVQRTGAVLDAVSWHEISDDAGPGDFSDQPAAVVDHVAQLRAYLDAHPGLGHPAILISEYTPPATHLIPGWTVGWIAALEAAGVDGAGRACWYQGEPQSASGCDVGALDGLLDVTTGHPQANYFVHLAYAQMTGWVVPTTTTDPDVTAFATVDPVSGTVRVLVGRHQSCTALVRPECNEGVGATPKPTSVAVNVAVPLWMGANASVDVETIVNRPGGVAPPPDPGASVLPAVGGVVTVPVARFADGDAMTIVLRPA